MPIPIPKIPINLLPDTPSTVNPEDLRTELNNVGLTCVETTVERLIASKEEVLKQMNAGSFQGYQFYRMANAQQIAQNLQDGQMLTSLEQVVSVDSGLHAEWKPDGTAPYSKWLYTVGQSDNFDYLMKYYKNFGGQKSSQRYNASKTTAEAIKHQFVEIANNISSAVVTGLNKKLMEAALTNIISPVPETSDDYDSGLQQRYILLVDGYDGQKCDGIGVVNVEYQLEIQNFKNKKSSHNDAKLNITVRASIYTDLAELEKQVKFLQSQLKNRLFVPMSIPVPPSEVTIYEALPAPSDDVFIHSLPLQQTENDIIPVMVLYGPDLEDIGCIDNSNSQSTVSYAKTITSGFSSSVGLKLSSGVKLAADIGFAKAEVSMNMEISFTEQWSSSQSETITYSVPAGAKAYLYQGCLCCAVLEFNTKHNTYSYGETGSFRSNLIKTTEKPIGSGSVVYNRVYKNADELPLWETLHK